MKRILAAVAVAAVALLALSACGPGDDSSTQPLTAGSSATGR